MLYFERGSPKDKLSLDDLRDGLYKALDRLGKRQRVLVVPPDFTRFHSQAGVLTKLIYDYYETRLTDVLPALGTHTPMTPEQIAEMYAGVPPEAVPRPQLAHGRRHRRRSAGGFRASR